MNCLTSGLSMYLSKFSGRILVIVEIFMIIIELNMIYITRAYLKKYARDFFILIIFYISFLNPQETVPKNADH